MSNNIEGTKEAVPVATAATVIPVAAPAEMAMRDQEKQGAKCCEFFYIFVLLLLMLKLMLLLLLLLLIIIL